MFGIDDSTDKKQRTPEKKTIVPLKISGLKQLPKTYRWDDPNRVYLYQYEGKKYIFYYNGVGSRYEPGLRNWGRKMDVKYIFHDIRLTAEAKKRAAEAKVQKRRVLDKQRERTHEVVKPQTLANKKEVYTDDKMFDELQTLIRKKDQSQIDQHLQRYDWQYTDFVRTAKFQSMLRVAEMNPQANALVFQLYARFAYDNYGLVVDGLYGAQTQEIIQRYMQEKQEAEGVKDDQQNEKLRQERSERYRERQMESFTKEQEISYKTSTIFIDSLSPDDNMRYEKMFSLPESTLSAILSPQEKKQKDPTAIAALCKEKESLLFNRARSSAAKACVNYLQTLFDQQLNVDVQDVQNSVSLQMAK